ncbi:MAG: hypothetical protein V4722_06420 [Bacteroidota bacterium]
MKRIMMVACCCAGISFLQAQELYVFTEPASNMATGSFGFRLNNYAMPMSHSTKTSYRLEPELMWGASKNLMVHAAAYASNMFQSKMRVEGGSLYAKYRFLSKDDIHSHFRMAAFGKLSLIDNPVLEAATTTHTYYDGQGNPYLHDITDYYQSNQMNIDGDHSGYQLGVVATKLQHKLAVSGSASYMHRLDNLKGQKFAATDARHALNFTASAGYLLLPKEYTSYGQTNFNLYLEMLGYVPMDTRGYSIDAAPAVQFIFNSIARLDFGYRFQIAGDVSRHYKSMFLLRLEYNWLNAFSKK